MGFQMAGRYRPLSKFMDLFLQPLILMASVALLSQYPLTEFTTLAFPQSILCSFLATCTAIPLFTSLLTTACLCSVSWTFNVLLDLPMLRNDVQADTCCVNCLKNLPGGTLHM